MMNVTVSIWYAEGCEECAKACDEVARAGVRDGQVTKITMSVGHRHNHPVAEKTKSIGAQSQSPSTTMPPSGELFEVRDVPNDPPNGFDLNA